jgi:hypothetical protein
LNTKTDTSCSAEGQADKIETQGQELGASAGIKKSSFSNLDAVAPTSLTLCGHMSLHSTPVFEDPGVLEAKILAKQDISRAMKLLFRSLQILIREYL